MARKDIDAEGRTGPVWTSQELQCFDRAFELMEEALALLDLTRAELAAIHLDHAINEIPVADGRMRTRQTALPDEARHHWKGEA